MISRLHAFSALHLEGAKHHIAATPVFFGVFAFAVLSLLLYFVLRLDRD